MTKLSIFRWLAVLPLLVAAGAGSALTLGRHQGPAVLGQPLDIQVPVGLDTGMDPAELCPEAEVSYGDQRVPPRLVDLQVSGPGAGAAGTVTVRVRTAQPLDEPFASVLLRVGCSQKLSRRFVLLADQPAGELVTPLASPAVPAVGESAQPAPGSGATGQVSPALAAVAAAAPGAGQAASSPAVRAAARAPAGTAGTAATSSAAPSPRPNRAATVAPSAPVAASRPAAQPRLRLDPLDIRPRAGATAPVPPASATSSSAGAANTLPGASASSTASTPDATPATTAADRQQALEAEVRKLQEALQRSQAAAAEMRARIAQVEAQRWTNPLVYGLAAIAALALVLAALAWRRQGSKPSSVWWQEPPASDPALGDAVTSDRGPGPQGGAGGASGSDRAPAAGDRGAGSGASGVAGGPAAASSDPLRASSLIATGRAPGIGSGDPGRAAPSLADLRQPEPLSLSTNELSDIQQEADFFVSLGEYDRAIEVLRNHIEIHPQASALAWLDLLEIQHKLGRKEDYEQLRHDFEWLFNARVPAFEDFDRDQNGLEDHPDLLVQIQDLWPGREVLEVIDAGIFRAPAESKDRPLSLQAYRDLLFLHQLARDITELSEPALQASAFGGDGPSGEVLAPARLLAGQGAGAAGPLSAAAQALSAPGAGSGLRPRELDINLDDILAHPTAASDPTQAPDAQAQFEQGLDELLNFDLDMGGADGTADRKTGGKSTG